MNALPKNRSESHDRKAACVSVYLNRLGSFAILVSGVDGEMIRVDFDAAGAFSLTRVRELDWQVASFRLGVVGRLDLQVDLRAARSVAGGGIEGRAATRIGRQRTVDRTITVAPGGAWQSTFEDRRREGTRISGEGASTPDGLEMTRRRVDPRGREVWALEATATRRPAGSVSDAPAIVTTSRVSYATGGSGSSRVMSYSESAEKTDRSQWKPSPSAPGSHSATKTVQNPDGTTTTTKATTYDAGGWKTETVTKTNPDTTSGVYEEDSTTYTVEVTPSGSVSTSSETTKHEENRPGLESTETWEKTTTDVSGAKTTERGIQHFTIETSECEYTTTVVTTHPDGSTTIETTLTFYQSGTVGYRHITVVGPDGRIISEETSGTGATADGQTTGAGDQTTGAGAEDGDGDGDGDGDVGGDTDDGGGEDAGGPGGGEAEDDGLGWDGGDEGPPAVVPHPRSIFDRLADLAATDEDDPVGARIAEALTHRTLQMPDTTDTGWGEGGGSESPPELKLVPSGQINVSVKGPMDGWGDWVDPRAHLVYASALLETVVHTGRVDVVSATIAGRALRMATAFAAQADTAQ